jgi:hypothetical protein
MDLNKRRSPIFFYWFVKFRVVYSPVAGFSMFTLSSSLYFRTIAADAIALGLAILGCHGGASLRSLLLRASIRG